MTQNVLFTGKCGSMPIQRAKWRAASVCSQWLMVHLTKPFEAWKKRKQLTSKFRTIHNFKLMVVSWERRICSLLLQFAKGTTEKGIVWNGKLSFVIDLWVDNPDICFLTKIPWIKVFCSEIPNSYVVKGNQNCCPCSGIDLNERQMETNRCEIITFRNNDTAAVI